MSEIKRWESETDGCDGWCNGIGVLVEHPDGEAVLFTDHEADLIKAKIEVLKELLGIGVVGLAWRLSVSEKIDQLQAQLGEAGR